MSDALCQAEQINLRISKVQVGVYEGTTLRNPANIEENITYHPEPSSLLLK